MLNLIIGYTIHLIQGIILASFYFKVTPHKKQYKVLNIILYSLGISPILTTLLIYYLLILLPNHSAIFYFICSTIPYLLLLLFSYKETIKLKNLLLNKYSNLYKNNKKELFITSAAIIFYITMWQLITLNFPIKRHDLFIYGVQGKIFFNNKSIEYTPHMFDSSTMFNYIAKHGFTSPLLYTWNLIINSTFKLNKGDFLFKSFSGYYLLLLTIQIRDLIRRKINLLSSYAYVLLLTLIPAISANIIFFHIDTLRIFYLNSFLILSTSILYNPKKYNNWIVYFILGIIGGLAVNIHSINLVMVGISSITLFLYLSDNFFDKVKKLSITGVAIVLFGGIHYILDAFYGSGTLLELIKMITRLFK